ncbi:hypothetical protein [Nonomuraea jiangxiensis]|uniref:Uncharacterized protein n=1 Tax=Nonomuraea jiangxiensis TaxID=633440 RepID=A0A1G9RNS8_9ACTN|nr:hypothetical protein [Nonomuraea jiangxiensis]SDM24936.1 hypothetical protein SAMN05421869_1398 [Nonomuraea jiangxiensis]
MTIRRTATSVMAGCAATLALISTGVGTAEARVAKETATVSSAATSSVELASLTRYYNGSKHWSTTGTAPGGKYAVEGKVAILATQAEGSVPIYSCLAGHAPLDQFLSHHRSCEGDRNAFLRLEGYVYSSPVPGFTQPIYRCHWGKSQSHFFSVASDCESTGANPIKSEFRLGYVKR